MTAAGNSLLTLLIFWGIPVYLLDRRARFNERPGWARFVIAFFMLFYFLIVPVFVAFSLAGPKRPRRSRRRTGLLADHPPFKERYIPYRERYAPASAPVPEYDRHSEEAIAKRYEEHQHALAKRRKEAQAQALRDGPAQDRESEPSHHSQTRPYLTPQQRPQVRRRREREQQAAYQRDPAQLAAEREAQTLQTRRERQHQQAQAKQERQEQADRARQAQDDLFMTWDERGEDELHA